MTAPKVTLSVLDGGLGAAQNADRLLAVFGVSSIGTVGSMAQFTDPASLIATYGYGPGVSLALHVLKVSGQPVIFGRASEGETSSASAVTHDGTGLSVLTVAKANAALEYFDDHEILVTITKGGTAGTDVCRATLSLDNGVTSLGNYAIPTTRVVDIPKTNVRLTFSAATLVAGDTYSFSTTAARSTDTGTAAGDITALIAGLQAYAATHGGVYATMIADADVRDAAAAEAIQTAAEALAVGQEFVRVYTSARPQDEAETVSEWIADISADFAELAALRVDVGAGKAYVLDPASGAYVWRSTTWPRAARASSTEVHIDSAWVALGLLPDVRSVDYDERARGEVPSLDNARFSTLTTHVGRSGFYVTNPRLMAPPGSDYVYTQYGRVMDKVCRYVYDYMLDRLSQSVRLTPGTGTIAEADAQKIEQGMNAVLKAQVIAPGNVTDAKCTVSRTDNLSVPGATFHVAVAVLPLGYLKDIAVDLYFTTSV